MNIGIIVQARLGSTRLPGKLLLPFSEGKTLLEFVLNRFASVENIKVIVATSVNSNNDALEVFLKEKGFLVFRGDEDDVLERFIGAADAYGLDGIVRICSDNPFLDSDAIKCLVSSAYENPNCDYVGFRINDKPSILTHFGFWGEYVSLNALKRVREITDEQSAHEHVTYYVYQHEEMFNCKWLKAPAFLEGRNDIRLTIDTIEDLENAKKLHSSLLSSVGNYNLKDIVDYLDSHSDLTDSMVRIINENRKK